MWHSMCWCAVKNLHTHSPQCDTANLLPRYLDTFTFRFCWNVLCHAMSSSGARFFICYRVNVVATVAGRWFGIVRGICTLSQCLLGFSNQPCLRCLRLLCSLCAHVGLASVSNSTDEIHSNSVQFLLWIERIYLCRRMHAFTEWVLYMVIYAENC